MNLVDRVMQANLDVIARVTDKSIDEIFHLDREGALGEAVIEACKTVTEADLTQIEKELELESKHVAYRVLHKLTRAMKEAEEGKRSFDSVFNGIQIRDCLPQHTVLATTWHIDDIRNRFPQGTSDEELYETLRVLESGLSNVAVSGGIDLFDMECPGERDEDDTEDDADLFDDDEESHHPDCPAIDGIGCRCDELNEGVDD